MNIQQLFKQTKFETIWNRYSEIYRINEGEREFLEEVYHELLSKDVGINADNCTVELSYYKDEIFEDEYYFDVTVRQENDEQNYSLSYLDWSEVIGYNFNLNEYDDETFLAVLLYELTFYGDEVDMIEVREDLIETVEGIKNGTVELVSYDSLDEFLAQLKD